MQNLPNFNPTNEELVNLNESTNAKGKHSKRFHFSKEATAVLKKWLIEHIENPYLKYADKVNLSRDSGLTRK